jgi:hypothetical protein
MNLATITVEFSLAQTHLRVRSGYIPDSIHAALCYQAMPARIWLALNRIGSNRKVVNGRRNLSPNRTATNIYFLSGKNYRNVFGKRSTIQGE